MWNNYDGEKLQPPMMKRRSGRPRNKRRKPKCGEPQKFKKGMLTVLSRHGRKMHCKLCGNEGHNKRGCPFKDREAASGISQATVGSQAFVGSQVPTGTQTSIAPSPNPPFISNFSDFFI
ncbi:hypothetical protein SLE2022_053720 [Rubroshorea leprosula]